MQRPENEAKKIYSAIFKKEIPEIIQSRFEKISSKIDASYSDKETQKYYKYFCETSDLEALEIAGRVLKKLPVLTDKFKVMVYLAETLPENYPLFVNERSQLLIGYFSLFISLLRTGCKLVKGVFIYAAG